LEGMAQGDLALALQGLLGDVDQPLSAVSVARLATRWRDEHAAWKQRPLECDVAYLWAEGIPLEVEAESPDLSVLVVAAAFVDGSRGLVSVETGERGSKESWLGVLRDLARRGMQAAPRIVVADGALGIWDALDELGMACARQHCWNSKTAEVLGLLPKGRRAEASKILRAISDASSRSAANQLRLKFVKRCGVRLADAAECISSDWTALNAFHAFPKEHWPQLRTTETLEKTSTEIRLRAAGPKACRPAPHLEAIVWKLLGAAVRALPALDALELVPSLIRRQPTGETRTAETSRNLLD
ncbi:MAG TPA: transposase, partial [Planctomycetota bacterium]|nr:transposase [Planctomycetota bacterium]